MTAGPEEIALAVARLSAGGLVAFPTETVYGLGADATNPEAVARVFALKDRPAGNPLIVHVADESMARSVAAEWPESAAALARAFWPGPLTIVLPKAAWVPDAITAGGPTVGVRCPAHHVTLSLLTAFGRPLVGPSANPSGRISPTTAEHVRSFFTEDQVMVLDGGPCRGGLESTVVTLAEQVPRILRPGLISAEEIGIVLGQPVAEWDGPQAAGGLARPLTAPGQLPVHYAPLTRAVLAAAEEILGLLEAAGGPVAVLAISDLQVVEPHVLIPMPRTPSGYAAALYASLRRADALKPALIAIERPPTEGPVWEAVHDRLSRATAW